jgi:hypothetical protein
MKTTLYLLAILALYGFSSNEDWKDQLVYEQTMIVTCDTDYDCMIKNPNIEEY